MNSEEINQFELLETGENYFPALFSEFENAKTEILMEAYIFRLDSVGMKVLAALATAARRGVKVDLVIDGFGSPEFTAAIVKDWKSQGVNISIFREFRWIDWNFRLGNLLRRLHRKTIIIDQTIAFVGGLNIGEDYFAHSVSNAKWDHAVRVKGPVVKQVRWHSLLLLVRLRRDFQRFWQLWRRPIRSQLQTEKALYIVRDNFIAKRAIENFYTRAIWDAKERILIANAYFIPSYRFLRALIRASQRGVRVQLLLQGGRSDIPIIKWTEQFLYHRLLKAKIEIHEFQDLALHSKAAVIDHNWSTIGSSNLDPWSLFSNIEGNLFISDQEFCQKLQSSLEKCLLDSKPWQLSDILNMSPGQRLRAWLSYLLVQWAGKLARRS
jgi:cardiolipin synthase